MTLRLTALLGSVDDREQGWYTDIGEDWSWMWPSLADHDARAAVHGGAESGPGVAGKKAAVGAMFGWRDYL